ncbi:MAG: type II toxin-antitoxin system RelE/ParE family toxin [Flavobacterium sp.]|nr:MAG: type II toxin-antitoxin system RelE/ParE family toxin [Flavobacterium sp.]
MKRKHKFVITATATTDILEAFEYYEFAQSGLGIAFLQSLNLSYQSIDGSPEVYRKVFKNYRQAKLKRYPYVIVYYVKFNEIIVTRVFNTYQNPI